MKRSRLAEAAYFMTLPPEERKRRALALVGTCIAAAWLDDAVLQALHRKGFASWEKRSPEVGDVCNVSEPGSQPDSVLVLTARGRELAREGAPS